MNVIVTNPPWPGEGYGTRSNIRWPHRRGDKVLTFPVYLAYTVSVLKKAGFKAKGIDAVDMEMGIPAFVDYLKKSNPDIVIMEVSTPSIMYDLECAEQIKSQVGCKIAFCGPHATYFHKEIIEDYNFVDFCIRGEFEITAKELCISLKNQKEPSGVDGVTFRSNHKAVANKERTPFEVVDSMPYPNREDFKISSYQQAFFSGKRTALMVSSRGCPYNCSFCLWPDTLLGHKFRARSAKNVLDEIEHLIKKYGVDEIYFDDDTFTIDKKRVMDICQGITDRKLKITWLCMSRVNTIDEEMIKAMKKAGCVNIFYGLESGSESILKSINKSITKEQAVKTIRLTQKTGISAGGSFIIGMPEETKKTFKETLDFAKMLHADYLQFALFAPFPGTKAYELAKKEGLLDFNSWSDFDGSRGPITRTRALSKEELLGLLRKAYISYYTSPGVILQNIKRVRTLNGIRSIYRGLNSVMSRVIYYKK